MSGPLPKSPVHGGMAFIRLAGSPSLYAALGSLRYRAPA